MSAFIELIAQNRGWFLILGGIVLFVVAMEIVARWMDRRDEAILKMARMFADNQSKLTDMVVEAQIKATKYEIRAKQVENYLANVEAQTYENLRNTPEQRN